MKKILFLSFILSFVSCAKEKLSNIVQTNASDFLTKQTWIVSYSTYSSNEMNLGNIVNFFPDGNLSSFNSTTPSSSYYQNWNLVSNNDSINFSVTGFTNGSKTYRTWGIKIISDTEIWFSIYYPNSNYLYQIRLRKN